MGHSKNCSKREVYSDIRLHQKTRKIANRKPNLPPEGIRKRRPKTKVSRRKEIIKIRKQINQIQTKKIMEKLNETRAGFLKR